MLPNAFVDLPKSRRVWATGGVCAKWYGGSTAAILGISGHLAVSQRCASEQRWIWVNGPLKRIVQHNRTDSIVGQGTMKEQWRNNEGIMKQQWTSVAVGIYILSQFSLPSGWRRCIFWIASQTIQFRKSARQKGADAQATGWLFLSKSCYSPSLSGPKSWRFVKIRNQVSTKDLSTAHALLLTKFRLAGAYADGRMLQETWCPMKPCRTTTSLSSCDWTVCDPQWSTEIPVHIRSLSQHSTITPKKTGHPASQAMGRRQGPVSIWSSSLRVRTRVKGVWRRAMTHFLKLW